MSFLRFGMDSSCINLSNQMVNFSSMCVALLKGFFMLSPENHLQKGFNKEQFDELCVWIDDHIQEQIGWSELMLASGLDHLSIQSSFAKYKSTTPMTWIRKRREDFRFMRPQNISVLAHQSLLLKQ